MTRQRDLSAMATRGAALQLPEPVDPDPPSTAAPAFSPGSERDLRVIPEGAVLDSAGLAAGGTRLVTVYLPASVHSRLRTVKEQAAVTYVEWILDAFDNAYDDLDQLAPQPAARRSGLPPRRRPRRRGGDGLVALQLRLHEDELAVLDRRRQELGFDSRSAFFTLIVELGLRVVTAGQ